ncbi:hypothetical protein DTL42_17025 [Bremerella cremea]|uniref:Uncharacterized protein n=1 Tax=Bremerella cremea TaxID=1031537 RepID=A0A368KN32_9BACT|nr:hypothetical protein [Bremerella cremea]RCS44625.1 hypothetical protein DTL42_17025 [Bremerella cremea]
MKWKPLFITACGAAVAVGSLAAWAQVPEETKPTADVPPVAETAEQPDKPAATKPAVVEASVEEVTEEKKAEQPTAEVKSATTISAATPKSSGTATVAPADTPATATVPSASLNFSVPQPAKSTDTQPPSSSGYGSSATTIPSASARYGGYNNFSVPQSAKGTGTPPPSSSTGGSYGSSTTNTPGASVRYGVDGNNHSVPQQSGYGPSTSEPQQSFIPGMASYGERVAVIFSNIAVNDSEITKSLQACSDAYLINEDNGNAMALSLYDLDDEALAQLGRVIQKTIESDPQPPKKRIEEVRSNNSSAKCLHLHFSNRGYEEYGKLLSTVIERLREQSQERQGNRVEELLGIAAGTATPSESRTAAPTSEAKPSTSELVLIPGKKSSNGNRLATYFHQEVELKEVEVTNASIVKTLKQLEDVLLMKENRHLFQFSIAGFDDQAREQLGQAIFRAVEQAPNPPAIPLEIMIFEKDNKQYLCIHFSPEGVKEYANLLLALRARLANEVHERRDQIVDVKINQLLNASDSFTTDSPDAMGPGADDVPASGDRPDLPATKPSVHSSQNERQDVVDGKNHANQEFVIKDIGGKDTESKLQAIARLIKDCLSVRVVVDDKVTEEIPTPQLDDAAVKQLSQVILRAMKYDRTDPNTSVSVRYRPKEKTLGILFSQAEYAQFEQDLRPMIERAKTQSRSSLPDQMAGEKAKQPSVSQLASETTDSFDAPTVASSADGKSISDEAPQLKPIEANVKAIAAALERFTRVELVVDGKIGQNIPTTDFSDTERQSLGEMIMRAIEKDPHPPATPVEVRISEKTNALRIHFSREGYEQYGKYLPGLIARLQFQVNVRKQELADKRMGELMGQTFEPEMSQPPTSNADELEMKAAVERRPAFERSPQALGRRWGGPTGGSGYVRGNSSQVVGLNEKAIAEALVGKEHLVVVSPQQQWVSIRIQDLDDLGRQSLARVIVKAIQDDKLPDIDRVVAYPATENNEGSLDLMVSDKVYEEYRTLMPKVVNKLHQDFINRMKAAEGVKLNELLKAAEGGEGGRSLSSPTVASFKNALNGEKPNNQTLPGQPTYQQPSGKYPAPAFPSGRTLPGPGYAGWQPTYQPPIALFDHDPEYRQLEQQAAELARRVKQAAGKPEEEDRLAEELRAVVTQAFEHRMERQRQQLDQAEAKLKASREHLQKRAEHADQIITRRVEDLTGSNPFPWNEAPQPGPAYSPTFSPPYGSNGNSDNKATRQAAPSLYVTPPQYPQIMNSGLGTHGQPPQVYVPPTPASNQSTSLPRFQFQTAEPASTQGLLTIIQPGTSFWLPEEKMPGPSPKRTNAPANPPAASSHKKKPGPPQAVPSF